MKCCAAPSLYKSLTLASPFLPVDRNVERPGSMRESGSNSNFSLFRCAQHTQLYSSVRILLYCVLPLASDPYIKTTTVETTLRINYKLSSDRIGSNHVYKNWNLENCPTYRYKVQSYFNIIMDFGTIGTWKKTMMKLIIGCKYQIANPNLKFENTKIDA